MRRAVKALVIAVAMMGLSQAVFAQSWIDDWRDQKSGVFGDFDLTAEQQDKLRVQQQTFRQTVANIQEELNAQRQQLRGELQRRDSDRKRIDKLTGKINALQAEILEQKVNSVLRVKEIMTDEQLLKLEQYRQAQEKSGESGSSSKHRLHHGGR